MASSRQCGNCGMEGHFRSECDALNHESNMYWHAAKAKFHYENPRYAQQYVQRLNDIARFEEEGSKLPFKILNDELSALTNYLEDLARQLDENVLTPDQWKCLDNSLQNTLPRVRELSHNCRGFLNAGNHLRLPVDGDIFATRSFQLPIIRDQLVKRVKTFVNGKIGKLEKVAARKDRVAFFRFLYANYPPKCEFVYPENVTGSIKEIQDSLHYYNPYRQSQTPNQPMNEWIALCTVIVAFIRDMWNWVPQQ